MEWLSDPQIWASFVTLTALEIVLGIDNLVFIAIVAGRLPPERQNRARQVGLALALITRLALLASIVWIIGLTRPLFDLFGQPVSWRDIVLMAGGLFLLYKGTREIHRRLEGDEREEAAGGRSSFAGVAAQIMLLDIVFSLDSVITAVGMANKLWVMATAIIVTAAVSRQLFPREQHPVNERNLAITTGLGNLLSAPFGGYLMCHGAGDRRPAYRPGPSGADSRGRHGRLQLHRKRSDRSTGDSS